MAKNNKPAESVTGLYTALPHSLLDSVAFMGASHRARSLLMELMRQHNPRVGSTGKGNNGHMHLSPKWLKSRGWSSRDSIQKAKRELLDRGLIIKTREGGLNNGADKYALTWLSITNYVGLDIKAKDYHPGAYQFLGPFAQPPALRRSGELSPAPLSVTRNSPAHIPPSKCHTAYRASTVPRTGTVNDVTVPRTGTVEGIFDTSTVPRTGNNVTVTTVPAAEGGGAGPAGRPGAATRTRNQRKRIVGKPGRSGKPKGATKATTPAKADHPLRSIRAMSYASLRAADVGRGIAWATR